MITTGHHQPLSNDCWYHICQGVESGNHQLNYMQLVTSCPQATHQIWWPAMPWQTLMRVLGRSGGSKVKRVGEKKKKHRQFDDNLKKYLKMNEHTGFILIHFACSFKIHPFPAEISSTSRLSLTGQNGLRVDWSFESLRRGSQLEISWMNYYYNELWRPSLTSLQWLIIWIPNSWRLTWFSGGWFADVSL